MNIQVALPNSNTAITGESPPAFTPVTFTEADGLTSGEHYIAYAAESGPIIFDHWENELHENITSSLPPAVNIRGTEFVAGDDVELVAIYKVATPPTPTHAIVTIKAVDEDGNPIEDVFNKINNASPPQNLVDSDDTQADGTTSYLLTIGNHYKVTIANKATNVFDHWSNEAGSLLTHDRNYEFEATDGLLLKAVFKTAGGASVHDNSVSTGSNVETHFTLHDGRTVTIKFGNVAFSGHVTITELSDSDILNILGGSATVQGSNVFISIGGHNIHATNHLLDIDLAGIEYSGIVTITINYDPSEVDEANASEQDVILLHYNAQTGQWEIIPGVIIDSTHHTARGNATRFSIYTTGVEQQSSGSTSGGGGGGGHNGGGAIGSTSLTFPPSYFDLNPLLKILIQSTTFLNAQGQGIFQAHVGEQIEVSNLFTNYQQADQNYAFIVQVEDQNGVATDLSWQTGEAPSGKTVSVSRSWTPQEAGTYTIKIFVWDDVNDAPAPLSGVTVKTIRVT
jgi:hypothetical protein